MNQLNEQEIKGLLDLELKYSQTRFSFIEQMIQKNFFITVYPLTIFLNKFLDTEITEYLLSPLMALYRYICQAMRKNFIYVGKYQTAIEQVVVKSKFFDIRELKIKFVGYSMFHLENLGSIDDRVVADIAKYNFKEII